MAKLKILLVDDEPDLLELISFRLQSKGHEVIAVESGDAAVKAAGTQQFDLVVTDWQMPGMDGIEVIKRIRQTNKTGAKYVLITGNAVDEGVGTLFDGKLEKPFSSSDLDQLIVDLWK